MISKSDLSPAFYSAHGLCYQKFFRVCITCIKNVTNSLFNVVTIPQKTTHVYYVQLGLAYIVHGRHIPQAKPSSLIDVVHENLSCVPSQSYYAKIFKRCNF